jgi:hypothetical protein
MVAQPVTTPPFRATPAVRNGRQSTNQARMQERLVDPETVVAVG